MNVLQKDSIFLLLPFWEQATSSLQKEKEWQKETEWEMLAKSGYLQFNMFFEGWQGLS